VAALRAILRRHVNELPKEPVNAMLGESHDQVVGILSQALDRQAGKTPAPARVSIRHDTAAVPWSGWPLVQRRIRLLQADAAKIIVHSEAIVRNVA
ncbi:MAG TPA: FUSC family protein, partial [Duganella sp.]